MNAQLKITGLDELRAALKKLPADLQREAAVIVQAQAEQMAVEVQGQYPSVTGNLRSHMQVTISSDAVGGVSARVKNTAKHSHLYEKGTKARAWKNGKSTGVMPAQPTFIPIAILRRRVMVAALVDVVERAGLTVTTSAA
jgi:HK97 gp10 family phage protein